jgi:phenylalanyl-tRNA synthetase alpha chain
MTFTNRFLFILGAKMRGLFRVAGRCHDFLRLRKITSICLNRYYSSTVASEIDKSKETLTILNKEYQTDSFTNVSPRILGKIGRNLHSKPYHPLNLIKLRIQNFFYTEFINRTGNPIFSVYDNLSPVVSIYQNFDSLLVPKDHVSRRLTDSYYINKHYMLRAHTSAHQEDLIKSGLNAFLVAGDVYRRDEIDANHYPVFHQMEGVKLFTQPEVRPF